MDETLVDRALKAREERAANEQLRTTVDNIAGQDAPKVYEDMSTTEKLVNDWNYGRDAMNNAPKAGEEIMAAQRRVKEANERLASFDKNDGTYEALYGNPDYEYDAEGERARITTDIENANADFKNSIQKFAEIQKQISRYAQPKALKDMLEKFDDMPIEKAVPAIISYMSENGITLETLANVGVSSFAGQSTEMAFGMVGGAIAGYAAGPAAAKGVYSLATMKGSAQAELWSNIQEELIKKKYDLSKPEDVQRAFEDQEINQLYSKYTTRAAVVGGVDAASSLLLFEKIAPATAIRNMLLARRLQRMANTATKAAGTGAVRFSDAFADAMKVPANSMLGRAAIGAERIGTQAVLQGALGAAGEGLGNVAIGEKASPVNMFLEFFGEFAGTPGEMVTASVAGASAEYNTSRRQMMAEQAVKAQEAQFKFTQAAAALGEDIKSTEVVQQWADRVGSDRTVWVDGSEVLAQEGLIEQVRAVNPETAAEIERSAKDGQSVPMPISDIIKMAMANEEGAKMMIDNSRTFEDGMTPKQARAFMEAGEAKALEEELNKAERRISASQKLQREVSKVTNDYVTQLVQAGTDRNVARTLVKPWNWYLTARSKMTGMAPKDLAEKLGIKVVKGKTGVNTIGLTKGLSGEQNLKAEIAQWEKTVDSLTSFPTGNVLMLKHTPLIMKLINSNVSTDSSFIMANHVFGGMFPNQNPNKSQHDHPEITADVIKQIPEKIVSPIAVFKQPIWKKGNDNKPEYDANGNKILTGVMDNNYIFMLDVLVDGKTEILPVALEFSPNGEHVLTVGKTAFGRNTSYKKAFSELEDNNLLVYADTQKVKGWNGTSVYNRLRGSNPNGDIVLTEQDLVKLKSLPENFGLYQRLSTAEIGKAAIKNGAADPRFIRQWASMDALMSNEEQFATNLGFMRKLPGFKNEVFGLKNKKKVADIIIDRMADNLLFLFNKVPESVRSRTRLWYDGGRKAAEEWATRYGLRPRQTAALIALYSPSNNWYNNLTMAERTLDVYYAYGNEKPNEKTIQRAKKIAKGKYGDLDNKTIKQLCDEGNMEGAAVLLRAWDEVNNPSKLYVQTPEGGRGGYYSTPRTWMASVQRISDAISVIRDGSIDNVSRVIGSEFKVRNFYNNLYDPSNPYAATIDTHQVGASLLRVMAGSDAEVQQNFGTAKGVKNSLESGQKGTYAFYFEALQRAAAKAGVLPREMQSITWEAIRAMFPSKTKTAMRPIIDAIWAKVDSGEMTVDEARNAIFAEAVKKNKELGNKLDETGLPYTPWQETPYNDKVQATYDRGNVDIGEIVQPVPEPSLMIEVAPGTDDSQLSVQARETWETLSNDEKRKVTMRVLPWVLEQVANETQTYISEPTIQLGGWEGTSNYSVVCNIADGGDYVKVASRLATLLHQDSVFAISTEKADGMSPSKVFQIVLPSGFTEEQTKELYENYIDKVRDADGNRLISGHSTLNGIMTFGVDASKIEAIQKGLIEVLSAHPEKGFSVDIVDAFMGEIKGKQNGENSLDDTGRERGVSQDASAKNDSNLQQETDRLVAESIAAVKSEREQTGAAKGLAQSPVQQSVRMFMSGWDTTLKQDSEEAKPPRAVYYPRNMSGADMDIAGTIAMMEGSDKSSFLHESSHAWLDGDTMIAMSIAQKASAGNSLTRNERAFIKNLGEFFQWGQREGRIDLGVTSDPTTVYAAVSRWSQMTLEEQRGMHELFAEGFERYLYDGSAPSEGLRAIFNRFREYLKEVYRNVEDAPKPISREVRKMYDTMFFSEQAASDAEVRLEMQPLFDEAVEFAGMNENERAEYRKLTESARATTESIINRAEANARGEMREATFFEMLKLKKERMEELTKRMEEVMQRKAFKAYQLITSGEANLSASEVERFTGSKDMAVILMQKGFAKNEGEVTPEILAEMVGVKSSNSEAVLELLEDLFDMQPKNAVEKQAAKELIYEQNAETGEFDTTPSETGNLLAAHNDERSRLLTAEYNVIARMLGKRQVLVSSARDWATKKIQSTALKDLHPKAYMRDEAKNAKLAEEAFRNGDYEAVLNYKRAQIAASEMARAALIEEQKQTVMRRRFTSAARSSGVWGRVRSAVQLLLDNHSMRDMTAKERAAFNDVRPAQFGEQLQADLLEAGVPVEGVAQWCSESKALQDMTVQEANEFYTTMQQLIGVGRSYMKQTLIADGLRVGEVVAKGREEIVKAQNEQGVDHSQDMAPQKSWEKFKDGASRFVSWHLKAQSIFSVLDRNKYGFFWNLFVRSANERANFENTMRVAAHDKLAEILSGVKGNILKDEVRITGLGMLNKQQRLAIALNSGNQSNLQRLIEGDSRITGKTLMDVYGSLTEEEWRAVEGIWKMFEEYKPLIAAKEVRVFGVEPEWIEFQPFTVQCKGGKTITVSGGYYPMVYDSYQSSRESQRQQASDAKEVLQASYQSATTKRSFTKSRSDNPDGSRVDLTLAGLYNGVRDVIHDLAWHEWLVETKKVLDGVEGSGGGLRDDIRKAYGKNFSDVIEQWRKDIAQGERFANTDYGGRVAAFVRRGVGLAAMGWNPMTAVVQLTGIGYVVPKVGARNVLAAMRGFMMNPFAMREAINNTSEFMKMRNMTQNREINDIRNRLENKKNFVVDNAFFFTVMAQSIVDTIAWQSAYEKFTSEGKTDAEAKAMADQVVIDTQGSGNVSDRAAVEREKGWTQILTPFYSFMNSAMNLNYQQIRGENNRVKKVAAVVWMSLVMPAIEEYMRESLKADLGEDKDDDDLVKDVVLKHGVRPGIEFALGQFVLLREISSAAGAMASGEQGFKYSGPAGMRAVSSLVNGINAGNELIWKEEPNYVKIVKAMVDIGGFFGLPASEINRALNAYDKMQRGQIDEEDAVRAAIFGMNK